MPDPTTLFAEIDGRPLKRLSVYRATSSLFQFTADPALAGFLDPCITGSVQDGVSVGYWLLLTPLTRYAHPALRSPKFWPGRHLCRDGDARPPPLTRAPMQPSQEHGQLSPSAPMVLRGRPRGRRRSPGIISKLADSFLSFSFSDAPRRPAPSLEQRVLETTGVRWGRRGFKERAPDALRRRGSITI